MIDIGDGCCSDNVMSQVQVDPKIPVGYLWRTLHKAYEAWLKTQHNAVIKVFHIDQVGEFMSKEFSRHMQEAGTICQLTMHNTPEYNRVAEWFNQTTIEKVQALLHDSRLPKFLWGEALHHVVYIENQTWTKSSPNATPYEKTDLSNLHPWDAQICVHDMSTSKLDG